MHVALSSRTAAGAAGAARRTGRARAGAGNTSARRLGSPGSLGAPIADDVGSAAVARRALDGARVAVIATVWTAHRIFRTQTRDSAIAVASSGGLSGPVTIIAVHRRRARSAGITRSTGDSAGVPIRSTVRARDFEGVVQIRQFANAFASRGRFGTPGALVALVLNDIRSPAILIVAVDGADGTVLVVRALDVISRRQNRGVAFFIAST